MKINEVWGTLIDFDPVKNPHLHDLEVAAKSGSLSENDVKQFKSLLNSHKNDYIRLYHGTAASHDVLQHGLLPTSTTRKKSLQSGDGYVYLGARVSLNLRPIDCYIPMKNNSKIVSIGIDSGATAPYL
jgi:hypothetical protein